MAMFKPIASSSIAATFAFNPIDSSSIAAMFAFKPIDLSSITGDFWSLSSNSRSLVSSKLRMMTSFCPRGGHVMPTIGRRRRRRSRSSSSSSSSSSNGGGVHGNPSSISTVSAPQQDDGDALHFSSPSPSSHAADELDIVSFLEDKSVFITGATGFIAKVLVEKILRVQPNVRHLYLLINTEDASVAERRLNKEIMGCSLFERLQALHGEEYEEFTSEKVSAVTGDMSKELLGMDPSKYTCLAMELDIIINSAGTTTFDERYDHALDLNTHGPRRIMEFAKRCHRLQLVMHVSTAYAHGKQKGVLHENIFNLDYNLLNGMLVMRENIDPRTFVDCECQLIQEKSSALNDNERILASAMKELGMQRANQFGWQDTYVFTKAMGEMIVDSMSDGVPTVIVRPSVVESSLREPFPGWIEGNRMLDPVIIAFGKGQIDGFLMDEEGVLDVVPVDMVINAMLAAMAKHACKPGLEVYQIASSLVNPLSFSDIARLLEESFQESPLINGNGQSIDAGSFKLYQTFDSFMDAVHKLISGAKESNGMSVNLPSHMARALRKRATYLANIYQPYSFYAGRFDNSKTQQLYENLSSDEKLMFGFNVNDIDWDTYLREIHIPGLMKHVVNRRGS